MTQNVGPIFTENTEQSLEKAAAEVVSALKPRDPKPAQSITSAPPLAQWKLIEQARAQLKRRLESDRAILREDFRAAESEILLNYDAAVRDAQHARDTALDQLQQRINAKVIELDLVQRRMEG